LFLLSYYLDNPKIISKYASPAWGSDVLQAQRPEDSKLDLLVPAAVY
jgi:hypothetical protein